MPDAMQQLNSLEDYHSAGSNIYQNQPSRPQFVRRMTMKNEPIEEIQHVSTSHRRFDSVPGMVVTVEKPKDSNISFKLGPTNTFNLDIKKLINPTTHDQRRPPVAETLNIYKPRTSHNETAPLKDEIYLNLPLQKRKLSQQYPSLFDQSTSQTSSTNSSASRPTYDPRNTLSASKGQESSSKLSGNIPLKTIDEEQSTYREQQRNFKNSRSFGSHALLHSQVKDKQDLLSYYNDLGRKSQRSTAKKMSLGNYSSSEATGVSDYGHSFSNSQSIKVLQSRTDSICHSLYRNLSSSKNLPSHVDSQSSFNPESLISQYQSAPVTNSNYGKRSRSLGATQGHKNLGLDFSMIDDTNRENRPPSSLGNVHASNLANYASVPGEKPEGLFIRQLQGQASSKDLRHTGTYKFRTDNISSQDLHLLEIVSYSIFSCSNNISS